MPFFKTMSGVCFGDGRVLITIVQPTCYTRFISLHFTEGILNYITVLVILSIF